MSNQTDLIREAVRDWFSREGAKVETIKNPKAEFLFKVKFMRFIFTVVRPNDQRFLQIESQIMISPQHQKLLSVEKMREFQMNAMKFSFQEGFNMWLRGSTTGMGSISQDEYNMYVAQLNAMLKGRELPSRVSSYEITGTTLIRGRDGLEPAVVDVSCTIDGKPLVIHAVEGEPLSWAD